MEFGKWELREDSAYYFSKDSRIWPSSNAVDEGKLTTEENLRNIYRDFTKKNFVTKYNYFSLKVNATRTAVIVSPGEAVIQGYHFFTKNSIEVNVPDNRTKKEDGSYESLGFTTQYTLGISLTYDAANHVTGDVVNKEAPIGESESLSGVYLKWFDECQLECNYDDILVLGRAWVQDGIIVNDGITITLIDGSTRDIYHGFEPDPFKDHKFEADTVELQIHGHHTTQYDTLRTNMTDIHNSLYTYDSMHFPIELERQLRTKPPSFTTDIQDYVNHIPDWYVSKYGDYMTGALRFNNLSIDAINEIAKANNKEGHYKDSVMNDYQDSVIISPRTYGNLTRQDNDKGYNNLDNKYDYNVGGTIMSIVPGTYTNTTDDINGYIGIHSALISQKYGESGLKIHNDKNDSDQNKIYTNYTRLVNYSENDSDYMFDNLYDKTNQTNDNRNSTKFIIENVSLDSNKQRISSINMKHGELFIDSYNSPDNVTFEDKETPLSLNNVTFTGEYNGSGIQLYTGSSDSIVDRNIDFRVDQYDISIANHAYENHRTSKRGTNHTGENTDKLHFKLGLGCSYDLPSSNNLSFHHEYERYIYNVNINDTYSDPYMYLGNLRIRSNNVDNNNINIKQNTIEVVNVGNDKNTLPYVRVRPRVYSEQYLAESLIQLGTSKFDDCIHNNAQDNALSKIIIKKYIPYTTWNNNSYPYFNSGITIFEQDYNDNDESKVFNKMIPFGADGRIAFNKANIKYDEIAGIYSHGNIGCSNVKLDAIKSGPIGEQLGNIGGYNAYTNDGEWVRFTRFRYDVDKDKINGGSYEGEHQGSNCRNYGSTYNLEFNTTVANRRANQIIWRYYGSTGVQEDVTLKNTPPVVLSYIHDDTNITDSSIGNSQGTPTKYTNWTDTTNNPGYNGGKGTYETYIDHNGNTHFNPTNKIRDFLLLENAGLSVAGDINNPSWAGDSLNTNNHLGVTIVQGRVYNAVYNDFAETYEKDDVNEIAQVGELIALNPETGKYKVCEGFENKLVVGVQSNTYAFLAGGNRINNTQDILDLEQEYFTVGIAGKVWVRVVDNSNIIPGDLITSSSEKGKGIKSTSCTKGTIIGKSLTKPKYFEEYNSYMILMQIMLS